MLFVFVATFSLTCRLNIVHAFFSPSKVRSLGQLYSVPPWEQATYDAAAIERFYIQRPFDVQSLSNLHFSFFLSVSC